MVCEEELLSIDAVSCRIAVHMCLSCAHWRLVRCQVQDVEGKLPPKVPVVVKAAMTPYQVGPEGLQRRVG